MWQHKETEWQHLFTAAGTNFFTARPRSTQSTLITSLYCLKCSLRTWYMHSQNNEAGWKHFRKASRKRLPCMLRLSDKSETKPTFQWRRPQLDTEHGPDGSGCCDGQLN